MEISQHINLDLFVNDFINPFNSYSDPIAHACQLFEKKKKKLISSIILKSAG